MPVELITSIDAMRTVSREWRQAGLRIGFVPTMGNLHAGHLRLVEAAQQQADRVVVSIFVNPLQFGPSEDFAQYPRTLEEDIEKLKALAVAAVFAPDEKRFYPKDRDRMTAVEVPGLSGILCGAARPGHFRGVTTVVNKLFNIVQPDIAVFGKKDYQQFVIIRQMVADLGMPVELSGIDTVREPDGLAMSSRNAYLSPAQRKLAPEIHKCLLTLREQIQAQTDSLAALQRQARSRLQDLGFKLDYLEIRDADSLTEPAPDSKNLVILTAVWLGDTRLIDNIPV